jgi:putative membrane-bound dehydrogenase-like protein
MAQAQMTPEKSLAAFQVSPGLEIKLWASEPLFSNPTCIDVDHLGRVWVCESVNYRDKLKNRPLRRAAGDRILILDDSKGAGKADRATVFYQAPEILAPLGIAVLKHPAGPGYTVFVCQSPDILVFEDKDGDGKADGPPRKLLSGFRGIDHDHGVHGILIGPDNKLYFSVGDQGVAGLVDKYGKSWTSNDTDCRAGTIWRCDQDGKNLKLVAHNFRNEYEPCVDSFGSIFVSDNDDDGNQQTRICDVMPGGNYGYHPRGPGQTHWHEEEPGVVPMMLRTYFGSPTGMCFYEGSLLPAKYQGQLLHTDAGPRHVRCYHLEPQGASYAAQREDMVTTTDPWFRPSDVCVAPDGSLFVSDWYDPGVGGHGMGDITRGRIYRIAPPGNNYHVPPVDLTSTQGFLAALGSPALSVRALALAEGATSTKRQAWHNVAEKLAPTLRARVYWQWFASSTLRQPMAEAANVKTADLKLLSQDLDREVVKRCLEDNDYRFRLLGIRLLRDYFPNLDVTQYARCSKTFDPVQDPSPLVCREFLVSLRNVAPEKARGLIFALARKYDGKDRFYLEAIGIAVGKDKQRRDVILANFEREFPGWDSQIANLVWELRPAQMMAKVRSRLKDGGNSPKETEQLVSVMAGEADVSGGMALISVLLKEKQPEVQQHILKVLDVGLAGKWRSLQNKSELDDAISTLLEQPDKRSVGFQLIASAHRNKDVARIGQLLQDSSTPDDARKHGIQALATMPGAQTVQVLEQLLAKSTPADRNEVLLALGKQAENQPRRNNPNPALTSLNKIVLDAGRPTELRVEAANALSGGRPGSLWLLDNLSNKKLTPEVQKEVVRLLRNSPYQDIRGRVLALASPAPKLDPKNAPSIRSLLNARGDSKRGAELLAASAKSDLQCLKCHTVNEKGGQIGPDLSAIGKKASRENLLESILLPSKAIADQYVSWVIETRAGLILTGLIAEETTDHVLLRDANGKDTRIDKKEIASRAKSPTSLMPADLIGAMTSTELVDLVEYMLTLQAAEPAKK